MTSRDRRTNRKATEFTEEIDERYVSVRQRDYVPEQLHRLLVNEQLSTVSSLLSPVALEVLKQLMKPGDVAFQQATEDFAKAEQERKTGKLAMNLKRIVIRKKHIAKQLNVSPATISRCISEIQKVIE
jgi:hypothetical protein